MRRLILTTVLAAVSLTVLAAPAAAWPGEDVADRVDQAWDRVSETARQEWAGVKETAKAELDEAEVAARRKVEQLVKSDRLPAPIRDTVLRIWLRWQLRQDFTVPQPGG